MSKRTESPTHLHLLASQLVPKDETDEPTPTPDAPDEAPNAPLPEPAHEPQPPSPPSNAQPPDESDDSDTPPADPEPNGLELTDLLVAHLEDQGWEIRYRWTTYTGHAFDARLAERRYDITVQNLDPEAGEDAHQWLITASPRRGLWRRIFRQGDNRGELQRLQADLVAALQTDPRTRDGFRPWQTEKDWQRAWEAEYTPPNPTPAT